jgi:hypothetical protein
MAARKLVLILVIAVVLFACIAAAESNDDSALVVHGIPVGNRDTQEAAIRRMNTKQLRSFLKDRGASCSDCIERTHLVDRALSVRGWATPDDMVAADLTPNLDSAATHLALHHISNVAGVVPTGQTVLLMHPVMPSGDVVVGDQMCNPPLINGTQWCHSISGMQSHAQRSMAM